ncbi:MAG: YlxR family protein [Veillonella sp.]
MLRMVNSHETEINLCAPVMGELKVKRELIRVALSPDGNISIDRTGKAPGREPIYVNPCRV